MCLHKVCCFAAPCGVVERGMCSLMCSHLLVRCMLCNTADAVENYIENSMSASTSQVVQFTIDKHFGPQGHDFSVVSALYDDRCVFTRPT